MKSTSIRLVNSLDMTRHGLVDLNEAVQNPGKRLAFDISTDLDEVPDIDLLSPLEGVLEGVSTGNVLVVKSEFKSKIVVECARCGEPIEYEIEFTMDDDFPIHGIPSCYGSDGYAEVVNDEEYPLFDKNGLKIDDYLRQGLLLNIPVQPLCSGSWDIPCANAPEVPVDQKYGHPAMQDLQKFRSTKD